MSEYDEMDDQIDLYPPWKEALNAFRSAGFTHGSVFPKEWFERAIGLTPLAPDARLTRAEYDQHDLFFLHQFRHFRTALLTEHKMNLVTNNNGTYTIILPSEQADRAVADMVKALRKALARGASEIENVDVSRLTASERQQWVDALAKALDLQHRMGIRRVLPMSDDAE